MGTPAAPLDSSPPVVQDRQYRAFRKHKNRTPGASQCPRDFTREEINALLAGAISGGRGDSVLYNVYSTGQRVAIVVFRKTFDNFYHGYPGTVRDLDSISVLKTLVDLGRLSDAEARRLMREG